MITIIGNGSTILNIMRDDFSEDVKRIVALRVGLCCSNPTCKASTSGPQVDPMKALNIGVASHITAASPNGPRYNPQLSPQERKHINNAIWLCQSCSKLIDNDVSMFSESEVREWKTSAEADALTKIGKTVITTSSPPIIFKEAYADNDSPLIINVFAHTGNYPVGTVVAGIAWKEQYSDVRVKLYNNSGEALQEIDLFIQLDIHIAAIEQATNVPDIFISSSTNTPSIWLEGNQDNEFISIPVISKEPIISPLYRVYCQKLLPKCEVELVVASIAINSGENGQLPLQLFTPKCLPKHFHIHGRYVLQNMNPPTRFHIIEERSLNS